MPTYMPTISNLIFVVNYNDYSSEISYNISNFKIDIDIFLLEILR